MSLKKAAAVLNLSVIATVLVVACASAQTGPGGASGTKCVVSVTEGSSTLSTFGLLSRQMTLPAWQGSFGSFFASQYANTFVTRSTSMPVVTRRPIAKR